MADKDYALPNTIVVRRDTTDEPNLVAGTDHTYDATTGTITIKKGDITGSLFLVASGVPVVTPPSTPENPETPEVPDTPDIPNPETPPAKPTTPAPLPLPANADAGASPTSPQATTLAATGDNALPHIALGLALLAASTLVAYLVAQRKRSRR